MLGGWVVVSGSRHCRGVWVVKSLEAWIPFFDTSMDANYSTTHFNTNLFDNETARLRPIQQDGRDLVQPGV
jgi:hypothetical protein